MNRTRAWLVVVLLAAFGLSTGVAIAYVFTGRSEQFTAQATLAMLPAADIPVEEIPSFWEVLNRGQATRSAAIVLEDNRWLASAAESSQVPISSLTLKAGVIPDTTLITVTMRASSPSVAERALDSVLTDAIGFAASVSGPFRLEIVGSPHGSARSAGTGSAKMFGALGLAGLLVGAGAGSLVSRSTRRGPAHRAPGDPGNRASGKKHRYRESASAVSPVDWNVADTQTAAATLDTRHNHSAEKMIAGDDAPATIEIPLR
ncbi:hypothetical protein [Mycobacterium sp. 155]|uniref:hypothetical protein n=1 Tax=Mycobacterium sp. 155 TaxID=1157943 RepID=UPI000376BC98|nr:hypothetical protein [Mycobacterium sp. 155]